MSYRIVPSPTVPIVRAQARPIGAVEGDFGSLPLRAVHVHVAGHGVLVHLEGYSEAHALPTFIEWAANYSVYGAHKLWKAARRAGHDIGRDQVARLMRTAGIRGIKRGRRIITTTRDDSAPRSPNLVKRNFTASAPNQLWVTDLTYVPTWSGVAYVCFIVDAFSRMIVGWRVASNMRTDMVLDALEISRWSRGTRLEGLVTHSDAGSQFTSIRYGERLTEIGAVPSIGSD